MIRTIYDNFKDIEADQYYESPHYQAIREAIVTEFQAMLEKNHNLEMSVLLLVKTLSMDVLGMVCNLCSPDFATGRGPQDIVDFVKEYGNFMNRSTICTIQSAYSKN